MSTRLSVVTLIITSVLLSPAVMAKSKTAPADRHTGAPERVACEGVFGIDVTIEEIIAHFGAENVEVRTEVDTIEGSPVYGTKVYGDDPARTITYQWFDEENSRFVAYVGLPPTLATPEGLYVGQPIAEVVELNGQVFGMSGFWWDFGGYPYLYEGGDLWDDEADCLPMIRFAPTEEIPDDIEPVSGDITVQADHPLLQKLDVRVEEAGMGYEFPEGYDGFDEGEEVEG